MNLEQEVVLGWAEPVEAGETVSLADTCSKIGGSPDWLAVPGEPLPDLVCAHCGQGLKFLLQIYAPLERFAHAFHRFLYFFVCTNKSECSNRSHGVVAYRAQLPQTNGLLEYNEAEGTSQLLGPAREPQPGVQLTPSCFTVETESMSPGRQREIFESLGKEEEEDCDSEEEKELQDHSFQLLAKFARESPGHVLRYCFDPATRPVFYSDYNQFEHPPKRLCTHCAGPLVFELQLNSQLLAKVEELLDLDWGVLALYSCAQSCQGPAFVREHLELQLSPEEIDKSNLRRLTERRLREFEKDMLEGEDLDEEELEQLQAMVREQEKAGKAPEPQPRAARPKQPVPETIEEKPGKLFDSDGSNDDWA